MSDVMHRLRKFLTTDPAKVLYDIISADLN